MPTTIRCCGAIELASLTCSWNGWLYGVEEYFISFHAVGHLAIETRGIMAGLSPCSATEVPDLYGAAALNGTALIRAVDGIVYGMGGMPDGCILCIPPCMCK